MVGVCEGETYVFEKVRTVQTLCILRDGRHLCTVCEQFADGHLGDFAPGFFVVDSAGPVGVAFDEFVLEELLLLCGVAQYRSYIGL